MIDASPGMEALLGRLLVRVVECKATFELSAPHPTVSGAGPHPTVAEISAPGATIGSGSDADLRLAGAAADGVSRRHLLVHLAGRQWTVTDCGSRNHTYEETPPGEEGAGDRSWRELPPDFPIPVLDGMTLCLAEGMLLRFELRRRAPGGETTARKDGGGPRPGLQRIRPLALEEVAAALLARRREDPRDRTVPSAAQLTQTLLQSQATVYRRLSELRQLPAVALDPDGRNDVAALAEALALNFPYLLAPSPLERPA